MSKISIVHFTLGDQQDNVLVGLLEFSQNLHSPRIKQFYGHRVALFRPPYLFPNFQHPLQEKTARLYDLRALLSHLVNYL